MCPETLANTLVKLTRRDLEVWCTGTLRALATAGLLGAQGTGMLDAAALATTAPSDGGGSVTRTRKGPDKRGHVHEIGGPG